MIGYSPIGVTPIGAIGAATATASQDATAPGASLAATSSFAGGAAVGASAGVAGGAQLVATSSMAPGAASGSRSATASGAALVASSLMAPGTAIGGSSGGAIPGVVTVPVSRTAQFAARSRVIVFNSTATVSVPKGASDELYYVGDISSDLRGSATTAQTCLPIPVGVTLLEGPSIQGNLIVVKLGGFDTSANAKNSFTFRVTGANGEQFDRTVEFTLVDDRIHVFGKDPDDRLFYALDVSADAAFGASALASVQSPVPVGITALSAPGVQGNRAFVKIGGLSLANNAVNSYGLTFLFTNGEKIVRTIYFRKEDH
jgi:hypothetical protein